MYNILVCDDEKDIVSALRIYLTAEGYRVFEAGNGAEALEVIDREDIHLALLDVMMPGMDGITALNRLREHHNLPVILLTAKSEDTDKVLGLNVGADDYVTKPFNPVELLARVRCGDTCSSAAASPRRAPSPSGPSRSTTMPSASPSTVSPSRSPRASMTF